MIDTIICGDCLEVMPQIPDKSVDMVLADLPYGITPYKWDTPLPLDDLWLQFKRIVKPNTAMVFTAMQPFVTRLIISNPTLFKYEWVWIKTKSSNFQNAKRMPLRLHETVLIFYENQPTYNPQMRTGVRYATKRKWFNETYRRDRRKGDKNYDNKGVLYPSTKIEIGNPSNKNRIPTQKPVALFEYLIRTYTTEGDTVLDPTCGSGTTAVACKRSDRHYICIEKEPEYCAIAEKRLKEML